MRKIALVGTAESGSQAPYDDESWEIWGVAMRAAYVTRATRWYEVHRLEGEPQDWADNWREQIKIFSHDLDFWMIYPEPDLGPRIRQFPCEHIIRRFGTYFLTSSFAWMFAHAIDELRPYGGEPVEGELAFYGVNMEYGTEYVHQRTGFQHFLGIARLLGIPITRLASSGLAFEPVPYPMWQDDPLLNKLDLRQTESRKKISEYDESIRHTRAMIAQTRAVIEEIQSMQSPEWDASKRLVELHKRYDALMDTSSSLSKDIVHWTAVEEEQSWLRAYLSP